MFLPTIKDEMKKLGWSGLDIILVSGDAYIDSPYDGSAVIGKVLAETGYKVGIISQPDVRNFEDITRLGEPALFWGVSGGCVDSMVANYTALMKKKKSDDLTPGGINNKRPDRAVIRYSNLIREAFPSRKPIILGGIEASLRRVAHYDYWSDSIRRSILFDSRADALVYGMGEKAILEIAQRIASGSHFKDIRGICYNDKTPSDMYLDLPSFEEVSTDKVKFLEMFTMFYENNDPLNAYGLVQKHGDRYLVQNPPAFYPSTAELDKIHNMDFEYDVHPYYKKLGTVKALETIQFSVNTHRGCFGECNFCAITVHQGRTISSRSLDSIRREVIKMTKHKDFKGYISDLGGPTANMYGMTCKKQSKSGSCKDKRCIFPEHCPAMNINHGKLVSLYREIRRIPGIKKIFIGSGVRYDLVIEDDKNGGAYLHDLIEHHVSGQMKIAPEHTADSVLNLMGKPGKDYLTRFKSEFVRINKKLGKKQFLTYYFISAHPGCEMDHMKELKQFINKELKMNPEQVQVFTPTPGTWSTAMYYTGLNPFSDDKIYVEKDLRNKRLQKTIITGE